MLVLQNIKKSIEGIPLLDLPEIQLQAGKLYLVLGPNGAGKSTFVKIISGQLQPDPGAVIQLNGKDIYKQTPLNLAKVRAVLSQNIDLAFPLTVKEVVSMGRYPHYTGKPTPKDQKAVEEALHFFDVQDFADRNYLTLSGGEKQRVQFARVLAQLWFPVHDQNRLLLLDEPLSFLDIRYQFEFMNKIKELLKQPDMMVIGVIHDLNLAAKYADQVVLLNKGKLLASGTAEQVFTPQHIEVAYGLRPSVSKDERGLVIHF